MSSDDPLSHRNPAAVAAVMPALKLAMKTWFRSEVRDIERVPDGGALIVSNHSGGLTPMDVPILAYALVDEFGADRPFYVLAHDFLFLGPLGPLMRAMGFLPASRQNAAALLAAGAATILFPGGDHDSFRPSSERNRVDFAGRTGYVRTALESDVPIVPVVSIGGQESQLYLTRGERLGRHSPLRRLFRTEMAPLQLGFPFGLVMAAPVNLPLPTKIVTQVLEPVDVRAEFGQDPDIDEVDQSVRSRMQSALDELAARRRFPVIG
jgi:1-acyl-sn-glycerol-3-phosphate acyltransferase